MDLKRLGTISVMFTKPQLLQSQTRISLIRYLHSQTGVAYMPHWGLTGGYQSGILLGVEAVSTGTVQGLPLSLYGAKLQFGSLHFPTVMYFVSKYPCTTISIYGVSPSCL